MNKKQKNLLIRIIIAAVLWVPLFLISEEHWKVNMHPAVLFAFFIPLPAGGLRYPAQGGPGHQEQADL